MAKFAYIEGGWKSWKNGVYIYMYLSLSTNCVHGASQTCYYTINQNGEIYLDGIQAGSLPDMWLSGTASVPDTTSVVALYGYNDMGGWQIKASLGDIVTDLSWKCSGVYEEGWAEPGFDDSGWPSAVRGTDTWTDSDIDSSALDIWSTGTGSELHAYCRKVLIAAPPTTTAEPCMTLAPMTSRLYARTHTGTAQVSVESWKESSLPQCSLSVLFKAWKQNGGECPIIGVAYHPVSGSCKTVTSGTAGATLNIPNSGWMVYIVI